jgi:hypothetical protein
MKAKRKTWIWTILLLASSLALPLVAADPISVSLVADGGEYYEDEARYGLVIGAVDVSNNGTHLLVSFTMGVEGDWYLNETHLAVSGDPSSVPQTRKHNPRPGKFEYSGEHSPGVKSVTYEVPLDGWTTGTTLYVAAHAEVTNMDEVVYVDPDTGEITYRDESAWGEGDPFGGRNWAMIFSYTVQ